MSKSKPIPVPDLSVEANRETYWPRFAQSYLIGKKIIAVRYMTRAEANAIGFSSRPVVFQLDDGSVWYPSRDDEGNDGGSLFGQVNNEPITLPVL